MSEYKKYVLTLVLYSSQLESTCGILGDQTKTSITVDVLVHCTSVLYCHNAVLACVYRFTSKPILVSDGTSTTTRTWINCKHTSYSSGLKFLLWWKHLTYSTQYLWNEAKLVHGGAGSYILSYTDPHLRGQILLSSWKLWSNKKN
jgi:hypothetical protein